MALERLQKFAIEHKLLDKPVFGNLEKPRVGQRDRVPTPAETEAELFSTLTFLRSPALFAIGESGHTNISTTQRYMHLDDGELADAQDLV